MILIHEWNGVVDRIKEMADSFAQEGYVALAADLYKGRTGANRQENVALMREASADQEENVANLNAAVKFLRARQDTNDKIRHDWLVFWRWNCLELCTSGVNITKVLRFSTGV